jgi:hypothetical protein
MADEVVRGVAEVVGDEHRAGDAVQRILVCGLDSGDEVVQTGGAGHAQRWRHTSTLS